MEFLWGFLAASGLYAAIALYVFRARIREEICLLINGDPPGLD